MLLGYKTTTGGIRMLLLFLLTFAVAQDSLDIKSLYVAPPTISDPNLESFQPYLNSLLVSSAQANSHWVKRNKRADGVTVHDKHTINAAQDAVCDYSRPLVCSKENLHWVMITDIFVTTNFATIVMKIYDEDINLIASASKSSYSIEKCKEQVTTTTINKPGRPPVEITEKKPEKCLNLNPKILASDIKQVTTILFASIHPKK